MAKNQAGGKFSSLFYNRRKLRIQTPVLRTPFGISFPQEGSPTTSAKVSFSLDDIATNPEMEAFFKMLKDIDNKAKEHVMAHSKEFLGCEGKKAEDKLAKFFSPVKESEEFSPLFKAGIPSYNGELTTSVYLDSEVKGSLDDVTKNSKVVAIVEPRSIYVIGPNIGISWRVPQIRVMSKPPSMSDYAFRNKEEPQSA